MNANTDLSLSRRSMLQSTGAVIVTFSVADFGSAMAAETAASPAPAIPAGRPPLRPTELDSWIAIGKDGNVTVYFGKIDGGQGTDLAMAQIVAEELDVPMKSVGVVQGDTALTVNQGGASDNT